MHTKVDLRFNICSRYCNLALGYRVDHILAVGVGRRRVNLLYASIRIGLHVVIRMRSVIDVMCVGENL